MGAGALVVFYCGPPMGNKRRFTARYQSTAGGAADTEYYPLPSALDKVALGGNIVVTHVNLMIGAVAGGMKLEQTYVASPTPCYLAYHVTTNTTEGVSWDNIDVCSDIGSFDETARARWVSIYHSAGAAGDAFDITIRGFIEHPLEETQPVSVEGYKWPLQRRY